MVNGIIGPEVMVMLIGGSQMGGCCRVVELARVGSVTNGHQRCETAALLMVGAGRKTTNYGRN